MDTVQRTQQDTPFKGVRANIVQSIRAHRVSDLQEAAQKLLTISCMPRWVMPRASRTCWT